MRNGLLIVLMAFAVDQFISSGSAVADTRQQELSKLIQLVR